MTGAEQAGTRRACAALLGASLAFVVYGSLVPFVVQPLTAAEAARRFARVVSTPPVLYSRSDALANLLLMAPVGFLAMGTLAGGVRRRAPRALIAATAVTAAAAALGTAVEFAQLFVPARVSSMADVLSESAGTVLGVAVWLIAGPALARRAQAEFAARRALSAGQRLLLVYVVLFAIERLLPLDLTLDLGELSRKYHDGLIVVRPFRGVHPSFTSMVPPVAIGLCAAVPVGMAAALVWQRPETRRHPLTAIALGWLLVAAIELLRVFVISTRADATDVVVGACGVTIGTWIARRMSDRTTGERL